MFKSYFLVGGAGFIGSHLIDGLLKQDYVEKVTIYDNFSNGQEWHYKHHHHDARLMLVRGDVIDSSSLTNAMNGHEVVIHLASNSDISLAIKNPSIDFKDGIVLTYHVLEAARLTQIKRIIYTSGSGVYGEVGELASRENQGDLHPISPYGASKLAGEAFISSYCHMFGLSACVFRFGNVVGPRQTHGVGYDFVRSLLKNKNSLRILGNGKQSKSYIYVQDVVQAVLLVNEKMQSQYEVYNVATGDYITVSEIANIVVDCMGLVREVTFEYTGGDRGWNGDVPIVRLNTDKIRAMGWRCEHNSEQSIRKSVLAMIEHAKTNAVTSDLSQII
ncbi:MAG: NAD-dependent epimerase/dehydratase family protein [Gammaproteobacteria bacterium]|nr:NAD-dependent epimerase/dehydratase family protein [Gammaproteobacteria bacterium]